MVVKKQNIYTTVENQLGRNNAFCDYPGKMVTVGTLAIALYWLTMIGMAVYGIHYHSNLNHGSQSITNEYR